ncbi:hypothetical protein CK203_042909 [Vitis vinifera]|uniref:Integrase zinc-binding domain-containing protein n=1 Tax=Vitis vinifera TaxID=29760 RepID=A0A438HUN1_VITVI|nr:hypothetical protein CK203_042909 [Vitis vinifera]
MLLLCLDRAFADRVMREVHAGVCRPHMGGHMLARKIMKTGYFWLTMETDCCQFVQRSPECQIHGDLIHVPPSELHALTSPWPFSVWGIDIIGKISPKSSSGHEFILVAIDYFTKAEVDTLVQQYGIRHHRLSAYRRRRMGQWRSQIRISRGYYGGWSRLLGIGQRSSHLHCGLIELLFAPLPEPHPTHWGLIRDPRGKFRPNWSGSYFIGELTLEGAAWLMDLDGNRFSEPTNVDQLKSFLSFLLPYRLSLRYVPCLKTTLRPWDQMSSLTASTWTGPIQLCSDYREIEFDDD